MFSFSGIKTAVLRYVELHGLREEARARAARLFAPGVEARPPQSKEESLALCPNRCWIWWPASSARWWAT